MTSQSTPGPELLAERSIGGVLVHLLGLVTGWFGPLVLYAVSDHEFTRANARHVINWHVTLQALAVVAVVLFFAGADEITVDGEPTEVSLLPAPVDTVVGLVGALLVVALLVFTLLTFVHVIVATVKAILGSTWHYPGAIDVIGRLR